MSVSNERVSNKGRSFFSSAGQKVSTKFVSDSANKFNVNLKEKKSPLAPDEGKVSFSNCSPFCLFNHASYGCTVDMM